MVNIVNLKTILTSSKYYRLFKYLFSGGTAAFVDLGILYLLTEIFKIWYLASAVIAFVFAFIVSFILQRFWTFDNRSMENIKSHAPIYLLINLINLGVNTLFMHLFVDFLYIHYITSQIIISGSIAIYSFFISKKLFQAPTNKEADLK